MRTVIRSVGENFTTESKYFLLIVHCFRLMFSLTLSFVTSLSLPADDPSLWTVCVFVDLIALGFIREACQ